MNAHLRVTMVQCDLAWQEPATNRHRLAAHFRGLAGHTDLVVLPEMFSTGFSMEAAALAEEMDGPTVGWMREEAAAMGCVLAGSLIVREGGRHFNRLVWARPDGTLAHYDKRHLFRMAGEDKRYQPGADRVIVPWRRSVMPALRILPMRVNGAEYGLASSK
jgi:predicted amidohydrolase